MNLANRLTILRILIIPLFMYFLLEKNYQPLGTYIALFLFTFAAITDTLDGYLARLHNKVTATGKFLDPLADKILISAALITLVEVGKLSSWIAVIIITREFMVTALRLVAMQKGTVIAADGLAKAKTISQVVAIIAVILALPISLGGIPLDTYLVAIATVLTIISGYNYFREGLKYLNDDEDLD